MKQEYIVTFRFVTSDRYFNVMQSLQKIIRRLFPNAIVTDVNQGLESKYRCRWCKEDFIREELGLHFYCRPCANFIKRNI